MLKSLLKTIFSDVRQAIVGALALATLGAIGGILYLSKTALSFSIAILTSPAQTWGILILVLAVIFVYFRIKNQSNSYDKNDIYRVHKVIILAINDYHEIELKPGHAFKIELKEIKKDIISYPYLVINGKNENKEKDVAIINFDRIFPLSPGNCVKQLDENEINEGTTFSMPQYKSFSEEDVSVFSFSITNTYNDINFFRCLVKHINSVKQEVELDVYYLRSTSYKNSKIKYFQ
jgi:hypothetical protein